MKNKIFQPIIAKKPKTFLLPNASLLKYFFLIIFCQFCSNQLLVGSHFFRLLYKRK